VNRTPPAQFRDFVQSSVDLDGYLKWMALQEVVATELHQDSRSFFIQDASTGRWSYVPWDLNNAQSVFVRTHSNGVRQGYKSRARRPLFGFTVYDMQVYDEYESRKSYYDDMRPQWSVLSTRILDDEALRGRYLAELRTLLETRFRPEEICPRLDATARMLRPYQLREAALTGLNSKTGRRDTFVDPEFIAPVEGGDSTPRSAWWLCQFVTERRNFLLGELARIENHGRTALKVDAVGRTAEGSFFVELRNTSDAPVDLGELYLTGDPRKTTQWRLPAVSLPPGGTWRFTQGGAGLEALGAGCRPARGGPLRLGWAHRGGCPLLPLARAGCWLPPRPGGLGGLRPAALSPTWVTKSTVLGETTCHPGRPSAQCSATVSSPRASPKPSCRQCRPVDVTSMKPHCQMDSASTPVSSASRRQRRRPRVSGSPSNSSEVHSRISTPRS
jgi:hypothetical protein